MLLHHENDKNKNFAMKSDKKSAKKVCEGITYYFSYELVPLTRDPMM